MSLSNINIGVIYPSRGLLYTETLKEVLEELEPYNHTIYWSHGNKLPACFNKPLKKALKGNHTHILILEDDMVIPKGTLKTMIKADAEVISCDYPIVEFPSGTILYDKDDNAIFTGTGFMLLKRSVFDNMEYPYFRSDVEWTFRQYGDKVKFIAEDTNPDKVYGHHDILFGLWRYSLGKPIQVAPIILAQRKLKTKGSNASNKGTDEIILYNKYRKINHYSLGTVEIPEPEDSLLKQVMLDGKLVEVQKDTADKLIKKGVAKVPGIIELGNVIIDTNFNKRVETYFNRGNHE